MDEDEEGRRPTRRALVTPAPRRTTFIGCFALSRSGTWDRKQRELQEKRKRSSTALSASHTRRDAVATSVVVEVEARPKKRQRTTGRTQDAEDAEQAGRVSSRESSFDATTLVQPETRGNTPRKSNTSNSDATAKQCEPSQSYSNPAVPSHLDVEDLRKSWPLDGKGSKGASTDLLMDQMQDFAHPQADDAFTSRTVRDGGARDADVGMLAATAEGITQAATGAIGSDTQALTAERLVDEALAKHARRGSSPLLEDDQESNIRLPNERQFPSSEASTAPVAVPESLLGPDIATEPLELVIGRTTENASAVCDGRDETSRRLGNENVEGDIVAVSTETGAVPENDSEANSQAINSIRRQSLSVELEEVLPSSVRRERSRASSRSAKEASSPQRVRRIRAVSSSEDEDAPLRESKAKHSFQEGAPSLADSQEPPTLASGSSDVDSSDGSASSRTGSGSDTQMREEHDIDVVEPEVDSDTSDDAMFRDARSRRVAKELAQVKKECEPFYPRSASAAARKRGKTRRRPGQEQKELPNPATGRYTAKQKGKGREVIEIASESESEMEAKEDHEVLSFHGSDESEPDEALQARQGRSQQKTRGTRPGSVRAGGAIIARRTNLRVLPPIRYSILADEDGVAIGASKARPASKNAKTDNGAATANPASYTRSRTAAGSQAQCHRCEAFYPKRVSFRCCTCSGGVCQRCLIEHFSDQGTYMAILGYLLGQLKEDLRVARQRQAQRAEPKSSTVEPGEQLDEDETSHENIVESAVDREEEHEATADNDLEMDDLRIADLKQKFRLPPNLDLSALDFQCPACKFICSCANCLRGPYPVGHPLHKASLLAAAPSSRSRARPAPRSRALPQSLSRSYSTESYASDTRIDTLTAIEDEEEDGFEVSSRPYGRACLSPIMLPDDDNVYNNNSPSKPLSGPMSRRLAASRARSPPATNYTTSHAQEAAAHARAMREQMDAESDYIPVVSSRKRSSRRIPNNGRNNAVPRLGSEPPDLNMQDLPAIVADEPALPPVRRSERVRLATKVGQQLGKTPATAVIPEAPKEPVFTLADGTTSDMPQQTDRPDHQAEERSSASSAGQYGLRPDERTTPLIPDTTDKQPLFSAFTTIGDREGSEEDDLPDFALSMIADLPVSGADEDGPSPVDTLATGTTSATSSLASPPVQDQLVDGIFTSPLDSFVLAHTGLSYTNGQDDTLQADPSQTQHSALSYQPFVYSSPDKPSGMALDEASNWTLRMASPVF